jgi:hypothetical protein
LGSSIFLDSQGRPHICYQQQDGTIKHAWKEGGVWQTETAGAIPPPVSYMWPQFSFALGGDVMHIVWTEGGIHQSTMDFWDSSHYPNLPPTEQPVSIQHAYSAVDSHTWIQETIWTDDPQPQTGYWRYYTMSKTWGWYSTLTFDAYPNGISVAADSSGNAHVLYGHYYIAGFTRTGSSVGHGPRRVMVLDGANSWAATNLETYPGRYDGYPLVGLYHDIWCDEADALHAAWTVVAMDSTTYLDTGALHYAKSPGWGLSNVVFHPDYDINSPLEPISVSADAEGNGLIFYYDGGYNWSEPAPAYLKIMSDGTDLIGTLPNSCRGNAVVSAGVMALAYADVTGALVYQQKIDDVWVPTLGLPTTPRARDVSLAQPVAVATPHLAWCAPNAVMYATLRPPGGAAWFIW